MGKIKRLAVGAVIAGAAGYVAGMLTAPKSGKETREDLRSVANHNISEAEKELKKLHTQLNSTIEDAKGAKDDLGRKAQHELEDWIDKAKDTKEKAREMISAIHEGGAEDRDLKKAIKDANAAIDHLKDYLKK